jgi:glutaredoxin 2
MSTHIKFKQKLEATHMYITDLEANLDKLGSLLVFRIGFKNKL